MTTNLLTMRTKYIEEHLGGIYFEFGTSPDGRVDISSKRDDTVATVSKEEAAKLIADRDELLNAICRLADDVYQLSPNVYHAFFDDLVNGRFRR